MMAAEPCRGWTDHVIVCGLNAVGLRTVEQLHLAGARVVVLDDEDAFPLGRGGQLSRVAFHHAVSRYPSSGAPTMHRTPEGS